VLGWKWFGFEKKCDGRCYAELVFFHPVGFVGHVVHCGASGAQNSDALFFLLGWDRYGFDKKRAGTRYIRLIFLLLVGFAGHVEHSGASRV
jgi:hypothetical protein